MRRLARASLVLGGLGALCAGSLWGSVARADDCTAVADVTVCAGPYSTLEEGDGYYVDLAAPTAATSAHVIVPTDDQSRPYEYQRLFVVDADTPAGHLHGQGRNGNDFRDVFASSGSEIVIAYTYDEYDVNCSESGQGAGAGAGTETTGSHWFGAGQQDNQMSMCSPPDRYVYADVDGDRVDVPVPALP